MNYKQREELETKLGRRPTQQEESEWELAQLKVIGKYCNNYGHSDVHPYEVVKAISDQTVEIRAMRTVQTRFPKDFHPGGFCGHYADNRAGQEYEYTSDESLPILRVRFSVANRQWQRGKYMRFLMEDLPHKHYDYNF